MQKRTNTRLTTNEIQHRLEPYGLQLVSDYKSVILPVTLKCSCGNLYEVALTSVFNGRTSYSCGCKNKTTKISQDEAERRFLLHGLILKSEYCGEKKPVAVQCNCGREYSILPITVFSGRHHTFGCMDCYKKGPRICGEISQRLWNQYYNSAKLREINWELTPQDLWDQFIVQSRACPLTGIELVFSKKTQTTGETTASLDRINSNGCYNKKNIWWIYKPINKIKWEFSLEYFLSLCHIIYEPVVSSDKVSECNISQSHMSSIKSSAREKGVEYNIDLRYCRRLWDRQEGRCNLTRIPLFSKWLKNNTCSLDRINSDYGYIKGNVQWLHKHVNKIKRNLSMETLRDICGNIISYTKDKKYGSSRAEAKEILIATGGFGNNWS
jgi:hypothetical protein